MKKLILSLILFLLIPSLTWGGTYQLLSDGAFNKWNSSSALKYWTKGGSNTTLAQNTSTTYNYSIYSARLISGNQSGALSQTYSNSPAVGDIAVTFTVWVYGIQNKQYLFINDGSGETESALNPSSSQWNQLTVTRTINSSSGYIVFQCANLANNTSYWDLASATISATNNGYAHIIK